MNVPHYPFIPIALAFGFGAGCEQVDPNRLQGYVEGEFVYVASPNAGELQSLAVARGMRVNAGDALFALDSEPEKTARDEAERRVAQARATLEDARKGRRPSEIAAIDAQLKQVRAALRRSESELARLERLFQTGTGSEDDLDRARATRDQDVQRIAQFEAELQTARLGLRDDQIAAVEANLRALEAALAQAEWNLSQKRQTATRGGLVFDTLYRPGEWVAAGKPVVVVLPPENIKVRAFVPEPRIGSIRLGDRVRVEVDGVSGPLDGTVSFISPRAEYTPPVIYSKESRGKLVFMVEIVFDRPTAANLHPGQPVDVILGE
jgi:HlyD family secretion protein